ncbi:response regulator [Maricaulaceae bacterium NA33B04]|nr:response regulator [Maricaulaceae bacterium NA33B04]
MKVLYTDDEAHIRELVEMILSFDPDMEVRTSPNGRTTIEVLKSKAFTPDVLLMDVMMMGLDGPSTVKAIKADPEIAEIPVIFFTAKSRPHEHAELMALGAIGIITKPFDSTRLAADIRALAAEALAPSADPALAAMEALKGKFRARCAKEASEIDALMNEKDNRDGLVAVLHRIAGSGATFGEPDLSELAIELEERAKVSDIDYDGLKRLREQLLAVSSSG